MYCPNCGKPLPEGARFCGNCGNPVRARADQPTQQPGPTAPVPPGAATPTAVPAASATGSLALYVPGILGALCAICSLFPWFETPAWITSATTFLSALNVDVPTTFAPWGLAGIDAVTERFFQDSVQTEGIVFIILTILWVAALIVLVLGVVDAFAPGGLAVIPIRNLLVIGSVAMVAIAVAALGYMATVNAQIGTLVSEGAAQAGDALGSLGNLIGSEATQGIVSALSSGFGFSFWLWATIGLGVATAITSIFTARSR